MAEELLKNEDELIGKITHYFGNIGVAIVELKKPLKEGDIVRIVGGLTDFTQSVGSMEVDHQKVSEAKPGESVGLKVDQKTKEGYKVYFER
ncbi:MAG: hypothetical protein COX90_02470 [Candidatus Nealsonbacteria bacterium CG_4_10_14_0_2_um_filter_38_17]|uniref:Translation elongation factor-like protein n=2 Tax=Candidatus Nealsoniibacteriota TaxID=1817911 RepID=A0A2M7UXZ6_9BACT|nr:MAG: hypothetical protein COX36_01695 [Candidatus Nealsonbacteria bacterium CG23_combo_of_CG06-09_8_20_14_all_38_19]PIZ88844.1 MAG: hypothetical protein COX90_02470 [Candidatus Nealsonbacteria bacterium CG_4_10_14_0_2_um_filter_38_17]